MTESIFFLHRFIPGQEFPIGSPGLLLHRNNSRAETGK